MEFITFFEYNNKEKESFIHYLQWTGNEAAITCLFNDMADIQYEMGGDGCSFEIDIETKFTEEMVDQHCKLRYGSYMAMFNKVVGKCVIPDQDNYDECLMNELFSCGRIRDFFEPA